MGLYSFVFLVPTNYVWAKIALDKIYISPPSETDSGRMLDVEWGRSSNSDPKGFYLTCHSMEGSNITVDFAGAFVNASDRSAGAKSLAYPYMCV